MTRKQFRIGFDFLDVYKVFTEEGKAGLKHEVTFGDSGHSIIQTYECTSEEKRDISFDKIDNDCAVRYINYAKYIFNNLIGEEE